MEKFIIRNWIWLVIGIVLTRKAVEFAYIERGYVAFGGEWLVLPVVLGLVHFAREFRRNLPGLIELFKEEDSDDRRIEEHNRRMAEQRRSYRRRRS